MIVSILGVIGNTILQSNESRKLTILLEDSRDEVKDLKALTDSGFKQNRQSFNDLKVAIKEKSLTPEQKNILKQFLLQEKGRASFVHHGGGDNAINFIKELKAIMNQSGWIVRDYVGTEMASPRKDGIYIAIKDTTHIPPGFRPLLYSLDNIGFSDKLFWYVDNEIKREDLIKITVGYLE
jgi:hypothetical protein